LTPQSEDHDGVHVASIGWFLPRLHDPDGHEIRLYAIERPGAPVEDEAGS
jgi:hypothetical protein